MFGGHGPLATPVLSYGCKKLPMDQFANCGIIAPKVCNRIKHEQLEKHQE